MFENGIERSKQFPIEFKKVADFHQVHFLDFAQHIVSDPEDGIHLTADSHKTIGTVIANQIKTILA